MRFLILAQYFPPEIGATQTRLSALARELDRAGHEVEVVTAFPNYPTGRIQPEYRGKAHVRESHEGIPVQRVWLVASMGSGRARLANYASFSLTSVLGLVRACRPDYLFVESPPLSLVVPAAGAARVWGARLIMNVADLWPDSVVEMGVLREGFLLMEARRLEGWSYRRADYVTAVTEGIRSRLHHDKGVPEAKLLYLPNGADADRFRPRPPDPSVAEELCLRLPEGSKVVLHAGTMGLAHGLGVALIAMRRVADAGLPLHLLFVGDGSERAALQAQAAELRLPNVTFVPPQSLETVARLCSIAHTGLACVRDVPLFEATRPSKIFPVMASGRPIVFSGKGETAQLIEGAGAGLVTAPEDPDALAAAFSRLAGDDALADRLGRNGRKYVEQHLTWRKLVGEWLAQLERAERARGAAELTPAKRAFDVACAAFGLTLFAPVLVAVAIVIRAREGPPVLYRPRRVGRNGRRFRLYKFRTMVCGADCTELGSVTVAEDQRITPMGRRLRRYKLDELPQLFNVLRGEMSLVGPRPEDPEFITFYTDEQREILRYTPGITSPASVRFVNEAALLRQAEHPRRKYLEEIMPEEIRLDLEYMRRATLLSDIGVLLETLRALATSRTR